MDVSLSHYQKVRFLYKSIMKLHRGLPSDMQLLGNNYTRDEFKRHKKCTSEEAEIFLNEWTNYAMVLTKQLGLKGVKTASKIGVPITENVLEDMRDDQLAQLYEIMKAAKPDDTVQ